MSQDTQLETLINQLNSLNINETTVNLYINKMEINDIETIIKGFRIPDCIKDLPKYEGNRHTLHEFIQNVDEMFNLMSKMTGKNDIPVTFLRAVRNKIQGEADDALNMYGTPLIWSTIKSNLISHYADKRNETSLIRDLHSIYQGADSIEKYFSKIIEVQSTLLMHVNLNEQTEQVKTAKETLYNEMCLTSFLAGLKEPIGSMVRARNPKSISEAYSLCLAEQNMHYMKNKPISMTRQNQQPNNIPFRNYQPNPPNFRPNLNPQRNFYYNHKPFQQPNNFFRNNFQNAQPFGNKPAILPPKMYPKPEPMDTTSIKDKFAQPTYSKLPQTNNNNYNYNFRNNFLPTGPPRFQARELFNVEEGEIQDHEFSHADENYYPNLDEFVSDGTEEIPVINEINDEDFHQKASPNQLDT